ncbi:SGNH/GDSL hydrolase family protein [Pseudorhodoferax sp.]|uniref:SGNH/GDSL hydrolase family protein n=1 Tax=Pseudorhodoferax sp. TaxID=1993553 RepID=UPI002DD67DEA|nr:SGNH/GDSL hydrolase family protein [Pseudorhodoferax sp.]
MATPPRKAASAGKKKSAGKPAAKTAATRRTAPAAPAAPAAPKGPLTLAQARTLVQAKSEPQQAMAAAGAVRRRAPGAAAKVAVAPAVPPTPQTVENARRLLAVQQHEERKQRMRDYKATLALLQKHGVKGLPDKAPPAQGAAAPKRRRAGGPPAAAVAPGAASGPLRVFAEGDSWFDYPVPLFGGGVIPRLENRLGVPILNMAKAGDETRFMLGVKQRQLIARQLADGCPDGQPWDLMLFSGGGNDIVDEPLALWLNPYDAKKPAKQLLNQARFGTALAMVQAAYEDLIALRDRLSPGTHLTFHGYDFPIPDGRGICHLGPWLKPAFDLHGYPADLLVSTAVVKEMLTRFAAMLAALATRRGVSFINAQGTLSPVKSSWHNELHPSKAGFNRMADRFQAEIQALFPGRVLA